MVSRTIFIWVHSMLIFLACPKIDTSIVRIGSRSMVLKDALIEGTNVEGWWQPSGIGLHTPLHSHVDLASG